MAVSNGVRIALALGAGAALFAGIVTLVPQQQAPVAELTEEAEAPAEAEAAVEAAESAAPVEEAEAAVVVPEAPRVETLRVEPDGMAVIAGRAAAGATVAVMIGAEVIAEVVADEAGEFVALVDLPPSETPRALSLVADPAGAAVMSEATYLVAPTSSAAEIQVAAAEPENGGDLPGGAEVVAPEPAADLPEAAADDTPAADGVDAETVAAAEEMPEAAEAVQDEVGLEAGEVVQDEAVVAQTADDAGADRAGAGLLAEGDAGAGDETGPADVAVDDAGVAAEDASDAEAGRVAEAAGEVAGDGDGVSLAEEAAGGLAEIETGAEMPGDAGTAAEGDDVAVTTGDVEVIAEVDAGAGAGTDAAGEGDAEGDPGGAVTAEGEAGVAEAAEGDGAAVVAGDASGVADGEAGAEDLAAAVPEVSVEVPDLPEPEPDAGVAPPVLVSDAKGVRVMQPALAPGAGPEVLATVAVDAISYDAGGGVDLAGRAAGGQAVRLYLDNAPLADVPVDADGQWRADLSGVEPGVYTLRVDQLDAAGEVTSRVETPFQREERETIAAAMASQTSQEGFAVAVQTVQPGNTLWAIARDRYGDGVMYVQVFEANRDRIRNPDLIYPGQIFVLPESLPGAPPAP